MVQIHESRLAVIDFEIAKKLFPEGQEVEADLCSCELMGQAFHCEFLVLVVSDKDPLTYRLDELTSQFGLDSNRDIEYGVIITRRDHTITVTYDKRRFVNTRGPGEFSYTFLD